MHRRPFLGALALGVGALACGRALPQPEAPAPPPSVAPFSDATYERRRARARDLMRAAGARAIFVQSGASSFGYLAGADFWRSERLIAFILPLEGEPVIVAPSFEVGRVKRSTRVASIRGWEESASPYDAVRAALGSVDAILVEPHVEFHVAEQLARAMPDAKLLDGAAAFDKLRAIKDAEEIARLRRAIDITHDVFDEAFAALSPGMRDRDITRAIDDGYKRRGVSGYALVQLGPLSALPHGSPTGDALADGMVVLIDGGCTVDGYWSDVTRTRWFGTTPPDELAKIHAIVHDAQSAAIARACPGAVARDLDRAAREVIAKAGYGEYFTHRLGHGIGLDGHEPPYLVEGNAHPLEAGEVFTVEPGIYLPGRFGVRIEDDVLCTEGGAELLSRRSARALSTVTGGRT